MESLYEAFYSSCGGNAHLTATEILSFMEHELQNRVQSTNLPKRKITGLGVYVYHDTAYLFFRSSSDLKTVFHLSVSSDGIHFEKNEKDLFVKSGVVDRENMAIATNFNISHYADYFLLLYARKDKTSYKIGKAWSKDFYSWSYEGDMVGILTKGFLLGDVLFDKNHILYGGDSSIFLYTSKDLIHWEKGEEVLSPRKDTFDCGPLAVEYAVETEKGILLLYHAEVNGKYRIGAALFDRENPAKLLWRCHEPVWNAPVSWQHKQLTPIGSIILYGTILSYWQVEGEGIHVVSYGLFKTSDGHSSKDVSLGLKRSNNNPLIAPKPEHSWEAFNTFNPAAIYDEGKVHILYRAQGYNYISVIGYAASSDGIHIDERLDKPIYSPHEDFEYAKEKNGTPRNLLYVSGGGYGGCEDPRITRIEDRYYLTYVAFDGYNPPRIALTSIGVDDFLRKRWYWERPVLISPPGVVDKSAVIFPEKIGGKYVIMHRIYPDILIDFVDTLNFDGTWWLEGKYKISPRPTHWDSRKIGAGAPPLKTKYGWLLIYQSVGEQDPTRYKIGAMLLDLTDPTKVLHRCQSPILEPIAHYENNGFKAGVIYPCGAAIIKDTLYIYYGGADSYVCVATANLEEFLSELRHSEVARLNTQVIEKIF